MHQARRPADGSWSHRPGWLLPVVAILAAVLLVGFVLFVTGMQGPQKGSLTLGPDDSGRDITVAVGQQVLVPLISNASTGFAWSITTPPDPAVLAEETSSGTYVGPTGTAPPGSPGSQTFRFVAKATGSTQVAFTYARSSGEIAETFQLAIDVGPR